MDLLPGLTHFAFTRPTLGHHVEVNSPVAVARVGRIARINKASANDFVFAGPVVSTPLATNARALIFQGILLVFSQIDRPLTYRHVYGLPFYRPCRSAAFVDFPFWFSKVAADWEASP